MDKTGFIDGENPVTPDAKGYEMRGDSVVQPNQVSNTRFYAGGSIITTADDLLKWDEALYTEKLLAKTQIETCFSPKL